MLAAVNENNNESEENNEPGEIDNKNNLSILTPILIKNTESKHNCSDSTHDHDSGEFINLSTSIKF